jgi:hypothetical protein
MSAPLFQHPDGMGAVTYDRDSGKLILSNEAQGVEASASIGPDGLRELAAALLAASQEGGQQ